MRDAITIPPKLENKINPILLMDKHPFKKFLDHENGSYKEKRTTYLRHKTFNYSMKYRSFIVQRLASRFSNALLT